MSQHVVITHNLNIVRHISDRTAIMYPGPDPDASVEDRLELKGGAPGLMNRPNGCEFHTRCRFSAAHCDTRFPPLQPFGDAHNLTCHYPR